MSTEKKSMPQNQQRLALTCCAEFEKVVFIENSSCSSRSFMGCLLGIPITNSGKLVLIGQMVKTPPTAPCNVVIWSTVCAVCSALRVAIWVLTDKDTRRCRTPTIWFTALCCSFPGRAPQWRFSTVAPQWLFFFCCFKHNWSSCTIAHVCCMHHCTLVIHHSMHQQWKVKRWFAVFTFSRMLPPRCALTGHNIVLNSFGWMHWISSNTHSLIQISQFCRDISYNHTHQSFTTL